MKFFGVILNIFVVWACDTWKPYAYLKPNPLHNKTKILFTTYSRPMNSSYHFHSKQSFKTHDIRHISIECWLGRWQKVIYLNTFLSKGGLNPQLCPPLNHPNQGWAVWRLVEISYLKATSPWCSKFVAYSWMVLLFLVI